MPVHIANTICTDSNSIKMRVRNAERTGYEIAFSAYVKCLIRQDWPAANLLQAHLDCIRGKGECFYCLKSKLESIGRKCAA